MNKNVTIGRYNVLYLSQVDSTNSYALRNLLLLPDRQVILAEKQTRGYGRLGRYWISNVPENIYMSLVLKPSTSQAHLSCLTQYMSVVICDVLLDYDIHAGLKWPNDVLVRDEKIAGILGESSYQGSSLKGYVLGTGINLNMRTEDLRNIDQAATSLNLVLDHHVNRDNFLIKLLDRFFQKYGEFIQKGFRSIKEEYQKRCLFLGKKIIVTLPYSSISGTASHFRDDGALFLVTDTGEEKIITAGDVSTL
jgi:BirA family biotin operon repressor/biotin-[acetyl-CoA-carboxylase] ligase